MSTAIKKYMLGSIDREVSLPAQAYNKTMKIYTNIQHKNTAQYKGRTIGQLNVDEFQSIFHDMGSGNRYFQDTIWLAIAMAQTQDYYSKRPANEKPQKERFIKDLSDVVTDICMAASKDK